MIDARASLALIVLPVLITCYGEMEKKMSVFFMALLAAIVWTKDFGKLVMV